MKKIEYLRLITLSFAILCALCLPDSLTGKPGCQSQPALEHNAQSPIWGPPHDTAGVPFGMLGATKGTDQPTRKTF